MNETFPRIRQLWADQGYTGKVKTWITETLGWEVTIVQHRARSRGKWVPHSPTGDFSDWTTVWFTYERLPKARKEFRGVLPRRWVVEGTQPHYLQYALDVQTARSHDRTHWVAQSA
jgi:transposase